MKKLSVVGNWKMNLTLEEARNLAIGLASEAVNIEHRVDVGVCPSFVFLKDVCDILKESQIYVGAQNMNAEKSGAFTGEVSGAMLKEIGCSLVILGHSERRTIFHESNSFVNAKLHTALSCDLNAIV